MSFIEANAELIDVKFPVKLILVIPVHELNPKSRVTSVVFVISKVTSPGLTEIASVALKFEEGSKPETTKPSID